MKPRRARTSQLGRRARRLRVETLEDRTLRVVLPIAGDWDGDSAHVDDVALYDQQSGQFFIDSGRDDGFAESGFRFGPAGANLLPLAGDWDGDGKDTVGLFDPARRKFFLKNSLSPGAADLVFGFGGPTQTFLPVAGDWNGDGIDTVGVYHRATGRFFLRNSNSSGTADLAFGFGPKLDNWRPIAGDWNGDSIDTVGLYSQNLGRFFLRNTNTAGVADVSFGFGPKPDHWQPIAGNWDGDAVDASSEVGLRDPDTGVIRLRNSLTPGFADSTYYVVASSGQSIAALAPASTILLKVDEVEQLLRRASAASASQDAIIAVVDRNGRILGVRVEAGVPIDPTDTETFVFAIDGAVAKARTAAFFASGEAGDVSAGPLTSRTVRFISQSTVTQREVESNPNVADVNSSLRGPGFVAPVGLGGHFPPAVANTPPVDLFAIEHTNRDSIVHPGPDHVKGTPDDIMLPSRFNVNQAYIAPGQGLFPPESYGYVSGILASAQSRGIATLPGGIPLFENGTLVGGIGVFFPGPSGFATYEQGFAPGQTEKQRTNAPRVLEAEWMAFAAAGGSRGFNAAVGTINGIPAVPGFGLPAGRIDLVGISLEVYGPSPDGITSTLMGPQRLLQVGSIVSPGGAPSGADQVVDTMGSKFLDGQVVPQGWLVLPHDSPTSGITAADVESIVRNGIAQASVTRAAIRLTVPELEPGARTRMVFAVADTDGNLLGLYRMKDATVFSIDVATAKARNTAYHADAAEIQLVDRTDAATGAPFMAPGTALTNRSFRFLAEPRFPSGVDGSTPGPYSILFDPGINRATAEDLGPPAAASAFQTVLGFDAFNPGTNFRDPVNVANQNGVVFFPGSTPLYSHSVLVGGFGVSGDGVDQDDVVTAFGGSGRFPPQSVTRGDQIFVRGVRLPFQKFNRNPEA